MTQVLQKQLDRDIPHQLSMYLHLHLYRRRPLRGRSFNGSQPQLFAVAAECAGSGAFAARRRALPRHRRLDSGLCRRAAHAPRGRAIGEWLRFAVGL